MDLRPLISCFAVAYLAIAVWGHLPGRFVESAGRRAVTLGIVMGLGAIAAMMMSLKGPAGFYLDMRAPLIAAAAFVGGPSTAIVAGGMALAYRLPWGGLGLWAGCSGIVTAAFAGAFFHRLATAGRATKFGSLAVAAIVSVSTMSSPLWLPRELWMEAALAAAPVALVGFGCTWFFILSLQRDDRMRLLLEKDTIYRAMIEALPDCLTVKDTESRFLAANPATAILMGAPSAEALIGKSDADFYPLDMAKLFRAEELHVLNNNIMGPIDQEVGFVDGSQRWITSMKTPLLDQHGRVKGILTHNRDVTDRKKLEAELLDTKSYLEEAMNNMADGLVLYGADRKVRLCNRQYQVMFPKTADMRIKGAHFNDIIRASVMRGEVAPKGDVESHLAERIAAFRTPDETMLHLMDGRSIELRTRPLASGDTLIVFTDVTAKIQVERDLVRRASQDPLTGLANRAAFESHLDAAHQQATAARSAFAVLMLDLDRFKPVNDTHGHAVGDQLLVEVAERLRGAVSDNTIVARLGGDEFAFLIVDPDITTATIKIANRVIKSLKRPFRAGNVDLLPGGSLGIAYFPDNAREPFELLRLADKALYAVKTRGGGNWAVSGSGEERAEALAEAGAANKLRAVTG